VSLLTILPVGRRPVELSRSEVGRAVSLAPLVGVIVWLPAALLLLAARQAYDEFGSGILPPIIAVATVALMTGALHLDGLADTADALGSRLTGARALAVMKDSRIGAVGAVALIFDLMGQAGAIELAVARHHGTVGLLTALLASRLVIVLSCRTGVPAASKDGMGASVAGSVSRLRAWIVTLLVLAAAAIAGKLDYHGGRIRESAHAVFAVLCAVVVTELVRRLLVRRFGGITGDVIGALVEVAMFVDIAVMAVQVPSWIH
jgi:adenosylcobinamide-GDP ribazoletransferase